MVGLLKFLGIVALIGVMIWVGAVAFHRMGGGAGVRQASSATSAGALDNLGQAEKSATERSAQAISCASGDKSAC